MTESNLFCSASLVKSLPKLSRIDHTLEFGWSRWLARVLVEGKISVGDSISFLS